MSIELNLICIQYGIDPKTISVGDLLEIANNAGLMSEVLERSCDIREEEPEMNSLHVLAHAIHDELDLYALI